MYKRQVEIKDEESLILKLQVQDTGAGMSEEMQRHLFQPFEQENGSVARKYGGSCLLYTSAYSFGDTTETLTPEMIKSAISYDTAFQVTLDNTVFETWVKGLAEKYNTVGKSRSFRSTKSGMTRIRCTGTMKKLKWPRIYCFILSMMCWICPPLSGGR